MQQKNKRKQTYAGIITYWKANWVLLGFRI